MRPPAFWWEEKPSIAAALLQPFAAVYGAVAAGRLRGPGNGAGVPVVCIGDLTLGGAGKTPAAIAAAKLLASVGEQPAFLTRGYGGGLSGPILVDPASHNAMDVGDEPLLLAREFPTVVARDRVAGVHAARAASAGIVVMDDGFQNPAVAKDCSVLVVDAGRGIGNGRVFPAGPLRAPLAAQIERAHALLVVGSGERAAPVVAAAVAAGRSLFQGRLQPAASTHSQLCARPVLAFAGIGIPEKFFATLAAAGIEVAVGHGFADHHRYTAADAARLLDEAEQKNLQLVTTEKDFVRLPHEGPTAELRRRTRTLPVRLVLDDEGGFLALLLQHVRRTA
ncbi:MAG TPA: tetraacyldisaccharide 4'-kinase [Xanthobacteraceae bacterium]|nr:tetraacyldisaccharide 4'-kinase [Xanthobacteraceae bacterium]